MYNFCLTIHIKSEVSHHNHVVMITSLSILNIYNLIFFSLQPAVMSDSRRLCHNSGGSQGLTGSATTIRHAMASPSNCCVYRSAMQSRYTVMCRLIRFQSLRKEGRCLFDNTTIYIIYMAQRIVWGLSLRLNKAASVTATEMIII